MPFLSESINFSKPLTWIFIGGLITTIGSIVIIISTFIHNYNSSQKTDKIKTTGEETKMELIGLKNENIKLEKSINILKKENLELHSLLTKKAIDIYNQQTGGDGFCEFNIIPQEGKEIANISVFSHGKYTLHDIGALISEEEFFNNIEKEELTLKNILASSIDISVGNINPGQINFVGEISGDFSVNTKKYIINISSRNGSFYQKLILKKINNKWENFSEIRKLPENELIYKTR